MDNFIIINEKIITSKYVLDLIDVIKKAEGDEEERKSILFSEFQKLILQGKITFGYVYTDNKENELRGRIGSFSGFRHGTQFLKFIPENKRPKSRSTERTCLRYYDFGRLNWRSFKKNLFVVATSFFSDTDQKWYDNPEEAGFKSNWRNINYKYKRVERPDTSEEMIKREKINQKEAQKRQNQIEKQMKKVSVKNGKINIV